MDISLGKTIREARKRAGLTLRGLAATTEVSYSYLSPSATGFQQCTISPGTGCPAVTARGTDG